MKKLRVLAGLIIITLLVSFVPAAFAHDATINEDLSGMGSGDITVVDHDDEDPWKGWADITVTNTGSEDWGDFHILVNYGQGVYIESTSPYQPTTDITGATWTMDGTTKVDFEFYNNPISPGESANFQVYTDNTSNQNDWFGLGMYPTPVPEPATVALLGFAAGGLLLKRKK